MSRRSRRARFLRACLAATVLIAAPLAAQSLLLLNGNVYTADQHNSRAQAIVAVDGRITFVGENARARQRAPKDAVLVDLGRRTVLPGLTDSHAHLAGIGFREFAFDLEGTSSVADLQRRLAERAKTDQGAWISGRGWIETHWSPSKFPSRQDLDAVVSDRGVFLRRSDGHAAVVNSRALALAGIDRNTPDPSGGRIERDAAGEPTGMLIDNAMALVFDLVPKPSDADLRRALEVGAEREVRIGWTQVQIPGNSWQEIDYLRELCAQGRLKLRVYDAVSGPGPEAERLLAQAPVLGECNDHLTVRGIKLYIDGGLGSRGAALLKPYNDAPGSRGLLVNKEDELLTLLVKALRRGIQVETHAIGDRGNRIMLDLYEQAFRAVPVAERGVAEPRWRIEHAQILDPADIPRFHQLGVIASMQPSHAISDLFFAPSRLGPERLVGAYAWRSLLDSKAVVVGGSDAPVERGDPIIEFYAAVVRRSLDGFADDNWHREQRVSREQALKMFTIGPAYAAFMEKERGSIEVGKQADFTVMSADIMTIPDAEILKAHAVMTIIGGEVAYAEPGMVPAR
ncbi:MAG TPA: amidohydrolase [Steroidobacteraceae bacterium]|nr:amidohydrolase [Steroidobacteraceae bacterium]